MDFYKAYFFINAALSTALTLAFWAPVVTCHKTLKFSATPEGGSKVVLFDSKSALPYCDR